MLKKNCYLILPAVLFAAGVPLFAQTDFTAGTPWTGNPGVTESVSAIMAREAAHPAPGLAHVQQPRPRLVPDRKNLPQNPNAPAASRWPAPERAEIQVPGSTTSFAPQLVGASFLGAQISDTIGYVPPDSMADVGTNQIVVCVNGRIRTFGKNGVADGALDTTTDNFFTSVLHGSSTSDPRVRYDRLSGRWFITMITVNTPNFVLIAVSSGPTITGSSSFTFYSFQADPSNFGDYDTLGVDANALYIGVNVFNGNTFQNTTGFVVNKAALMSGTLTVTTFANLITSSGHPRQTHGPITPQGVNNDSPSATMGYFIGVDAGSFGTLIVRQISNPGGTPAISGNLLITVPATDNPLSGVPALGSSVNLDNLDDRLFATRMHNGSLWTAHNIQVNSSGVASGTGGRDGSRWYQLTNLSSTPTLVQSGTLYDSAGSSPRNFWIPSCAMSGQGHMALGSSVAGANEHADIATAGRFAGDTPGTIQSPTTAVTSSTTYNIGSQNGKYRWGDFSVTTVDPSDDMTFWTVQEYCNTNNSWGVQVVKLLAPPPALPTGCSPSTVTQGVANVTMVIAGSATNGSGFFDPGTGFPNHITASVNGGGVTVNSIAYNNPTNVTVNLTILSNAAVGARTVTITNPDGQSTASAAGILTIASRGSLISPNMTLVSSENPSGFKDAVHFSTSLAPASAGGTIQFSTNGAVFDTEPVTTGSAISMNLSSLPRGTNFIAAVYSGDANDLPATNTLEQIVTNHPPIAAPAVYNRLAGYPLDIAVADLATNWSDADGDTVSLAAIGVSTNGVAVTNNAGTLVYLDTNDVNDKFICTVSDGWGGTNFQPVYVTIVLTNVPPVIAGVTADSNGAVTLNLNGAPGYTYVLEAKTNLALLNWQPIATNTLGTNGVWLFSDTDSTNFPQRFYRLMLPPQ